MVEFVKADISQKADMIDFITYVFSYDHAPHEFKRLVPKVYADEIDVLNETHYMAMEDKKIKAVVSNRVMEEQVGAQTLRYGLIGAVSVHPYARGKGYMKMLMKMALDESRREGLDVMALGGQRQRYAYFGFERVGTNYQYMLNKNNIRHCLKDVDAAGITFDVMTQPNEEELDRVKALYERRPAHGVRPREYLFYIMRNWASELRIIKKDGAMIGYVYGNMAELALEDSRDLPAVTKAWFAQVSDAPLSFSVPMYEKEQCEFFTRICERMSILPVEMICVLNWQRMLQVMLEFKATFTPLQDGEAAFRIEDEAFCMKVCDGAVCVEKIEPADTLPQYTQNEAEILFFGMQNMLIPKEEYKNWLPLPFCVDLPDTF